MATATAAGAPPGIVVPQWRPWVLLHAGFGALALLVLLLPAPDLGWRVLALVVLYHAAVVLTAQAASARALWRAWTVLAPLSLLMVLPDWFLSDVLGILDFPDNGGPAIGTVPLAMAGMWTIALMPVVGLSLAAGQHGGRWAAHAAAAAAGAVMFVGAELAAPAIGLWEPVGVAMIGGVAAYVVVPEVVLSVCAAALVRAAVRRTSDRASLAAATVLLPFTYLGLLATSYQFLGGR